MKTFISFLIFSFFAGNMTLAQNVGQRVKNRATDDANYKIDSKVDNAVDKADNAVSNIFKKKNKKNRDKKSNTSVENDGSSTNATATTSSVDNTIQGDNTNPTNNSSSPNTSVNSGNTTVTADTVISDFTPGASVIFHDDFKKDALSDFPAKWNSTGSGKVSTIDGVDGRWLEIADNTLVTPYMEKSLPENCTIEFDLFLNSPEGAMVPFIQFGFSDSKNILTQDVYRSKRFWVSLDNYNDNSTYVVNYGLNDLDPIGNKQSFPLTSYANKILHVSIAVNKTRARVYLDQTKIVDLPRVLAPAMLHSFYIANYPKIPASTAGLFIGNVRIATAGEDARSQLVKQLMEEGSASTSDILFDVNSDVIKPESYKIIDQFGDALKANPSLKIKIIGYTDSDGDAGSNLTLSKKRAASVKTYLLYKFGIKDSRMQTDGKGEADPIASNNSEEGKAKNRRVKFIKL